MSIPRGAKWVYDGKRKVGVILSGGNRVTRGEGERLGARESGYKNPTQERKSTGDRKAFIAKSDGFKKFVQRANSHAGKRVDRRALESAYWRMHVAGQNLRAAPRGSAIEREAQVEHQKAMTAAGALTGGRTDYFPKSGDTP